MTRLKMPFQMFIEETEGNVVSDGFHLGTIPETAVQLVAERFHGRIKAGMPTVTTALKDSAGRLLAVYDGEWHNVAPEIRPYV